MEIKETVMNNSNKYKGRKTIEELFEMYAWEIYERTETNKKQARQIIELQEKFEKGLTEEQKKQFRKYNEIKNKNYAETDKNIFVYGFKLAMQLLTESLY